MIDVRIHSLQHVPFEEMAMIETWAQDRRHSVSKTLLFRGEALPELAEFDWLEKRFIKRAIDEGKNSEQFA